MIAYKFKSLNSPYDIGSLISDQIWASTPDSLNDPFEALVDSRSLYETLDWFKANPHYDDVITN